MIPSVLSIQSHVAFGHVGNRAAVFPLERMGFEVVPVNTVQFSNHPGYGRFNGEVFATEHVAEVIAGIDAVGGFATTRAVLSGYLGDAAVGRVVLEAAAMLRNRDPAVIHCCDPVMGDVGRGFFVRPGIPEFFRDLAVPRATILTPNQFELEWLTGAEVTSTARALDACDMLHRQGVRTVLVTSFRHHDTPDDAIDMLVSDRTGGRHVVRSRRLDLSPAPNGAGDCVAALFCGAVLKGYSTAEALGRTAAAIEAVFAATAAAGGRELALVAAQEAFALEISHPVTTL